MFVLSEKNKLFNVKVNSFDDGIFQAYIEDKSGQIQGEITFKIYADRTWIYNIHTEEKFQHIGVGQTLLDICEYISAKKRVYIIEGKYFPRNDYAQPFYKKNGYSIDKDDYDLQIYKRLNIEKVFERLKNRIFQSAKELTPTLN